MKPNGQNLAIAFLAASSLGLGVQLYHTRRQLEDARKAPALQAKRGDIHIPAAPDAIKPPPAAPAVAEAPPLDARPPHPTPTSAPRAVPEGATAPARASRRRCRS